jgi:fibronectin type 3 domain-containing protein
LVASAVSSTEIDLTWTDNSNNETGFGIQRSTDNKTFALLTNVGANVTFYPDATVGAATKYYYKVTATNSAGHSAFSNVANATTPGNTTPTPTPTPTASPTPTVTPTPSPTLTPTPTATPTPTSSPTPTPSATAQSTPGAPTALAVQAVSSNEIDLGWTDNSNNETGFGIQRSGDGKTFTSVGSAGVNTTMYQDIGLNPSTKYFYRVAATNSSGHSNFSNTNNATTPSSQ